VLQFLQRQHDETGRSYRRLIAAYDLPRSSVLRWQANVRRGDPPIRAPGPKKLPLLDQTALDLEITGLSHGPKRTAGTAALQRRWEAFVSREWLSHRVAEERRNRHRLERDRLQILAWHYPGAVWAMDEAFLDGCRWLLVTDSASRYRFPLLLADILPAERVAEYLRLLFDQYTPPLALKHDNGSNLANDIVRQLLQDAHVLDLVSPCYWPRYNGAVEYAQRELKIVARILRDHHGLPLHQALVLAPGIINARPRPILHGATANDVFHAPRTDLAWAFTTDSRKERADWIHNRQRVILARMTDCSRRAQDVARRLATEQCMLNLGVLTRVQREMVSPLSP
jgi:hypothetical protein